MTKPNLTKVTEDLNRLINEEIHQLESPIERAMAVVGDKYSFRIIQILQHYGRQRFVELETQVTGISPRTLSARLKHLERYGILSRYQYPTIPPKVEYELTEKGRAMQPVRAERWYPHTAWVKSRFKH
jgi:DNA-binding HxlR family transcriptional regulator